MSLEPLCFLLGEMSPQVLYPFVNWIVCLPGVSSLYVRGTKPLSQLSLASVFSHTVGPLFILLMVLSPCSSL